MVKANVNKASKTITFEKGSDTVSVPFDDYDEWGSVTLGDTLYDYHIIDDDGLSVTLYELTEPDEHGYQHVKCNNYYNCRVTF